MGISVCSLLSPYLSYRIAGGEPDIYWRFIFVIVSAVWVGIVMWGGDKFRGHTRVGCGTRVRGEGTYRVWYGDISSTMELKRQTKYSKAQHIPPSRSCHEYPSS